MHQVGPRSKNSRYGGYFSLLCLGVVESLRWFRLQGVSNSTQAADKQEPVRGKPIKIEEADLLCPESGSQRATE